MQATFGVGIVPSASGRSDPVLEARRAEELGFDLVTVWDHLPGSRPSFETWTLLTWIAASTSRIRLATNVLALPNRPPAVTAKMAESLDRLSGGRLVLGLGAGGSDHEFQAFGLDVRSRAQKVEALEEAVAIIRGLWAEASFSFHGRHFNVEGATMEPKPTRAIPIWLGVYGPRGLRLAGRAADGWIPSLPYAPPNRAAELMRRVREAASRAGRDPSQLTYAYNIPVRVGGAPADDVESLVAGGANAVTERLADLLGTGFNCLNFWLTGDREEQLERLATEVVPQLRESAG